MALRLRNAISVLCFSVLLLWIFPAAAGELEGPARCNATYCSSTGAIPVARMAAVDLIMYSGLVLLWPSDFGPGTGSVEQFKSNFHNPPYYNPEETFLQTDDDPWVINGVLHALYGSEAYLSFRSWHHSGLAAFLFTVANTVVWEYFVEGWFHAPSAIDLIWTPFAGAALGELRFQLLLLIDRKMKRGPGKTALMILLDPFGSLERSATGCRLQ